MALVEKLVDRPVKTNETMRDRYTHRYRLGKKEGTTKAFYWRRFNASLRVWALMQRVRKREIVWNKETKEWVWKGL